MRHPGETTSIDICVCTFQRVELLHTLESLDRLKMMKDHEVRIILVDNDWKPTAKALVDDFAKKSKHPIAYLHAPAGNISIARNKCLEASTAKLVAFIDDDEIVTENWLKCLIQEMQTSGADVVLGPVIARHLDPAPNWLKSGDFHSTYPVWIKGQIRTGYTCNVLMKMTAPSLSGRRFNLLRGQTGGEDTEFFKKVFECGGRFSYSENAIVTETVPEKRATFDWLMKRRFRAGQTHGKLLAEPLGTPAKVFETARALSKVFYCALCYCLHITSRTRRNTALLRGGLHIGTVSGILGFNELEQYGMSASTGVSNEPT